MFEAFFIVIVIGFIFIVGLIVAFVFYLINLMNLLKEIDESNRQMPPANVFLMFIPLFNLVYPFIMYPKISESIRLEAESRGMPAFGDSLKALGMVIAIASVVQVVCEQLKAESIYIAGLGSLLSLGCLVLWIVYWVKAARIKKTFIDTPKNGSIGMTSRPDLLD